MYCYNIISYYIILHPNVYIHMQVLEPPEGLALRAYGYAPNITIT